MRLSSLHRKEVKDQLANDQFDILIIGGGITGAGIALDAATRGLKTALIEKNDYASGTSSRSTKLIHGGLRYLKQFEVALVREVGRERAIVHNLAPNLVNAEKMLLPITKEGNFGKFLTSIGLMIYDVLAGVESIDQRQMLTKEEALEKEPLLDPTDLEGAGIYAEYRTDDARLTIEVIKTAALHEAVCLNYCDAVDFIYQDRKVVGVKAKDSITGDDLFIKSKYVINATGPWVDDVRDVNKSSKIKSLRLSKGVHIVVPHEKFPIKQAIYYDVPDGRMIFSIPRGRVTYIGTTDTFYNENKNEVKATKMDVYYLIDAVNNAFPKVNLQIEDVVSSWAGLRPLIFEEGKTASELSRKDEIFESESGLISIAGGKLTGYRKMAERVVNKVVELLDENYDKQYSDCQTDQIPLSGSNFGNPKEVKKFQNNIAEELGELGLTEYHAYHLVSNYGRQSGRILEKMKLKEGADAELRLVLAEAAYTIENEHAIYSSDYFVRRSGRLYFDIESVKKYQQQVINVFAEKLKKNKFEKEEDKKLMDKAIKEATIFD